MGANVTAALLLLPAVQAQATLHAQPALQAQPAAQAQSAAITDSPPASPDMATPITVPAGTPILVTMASDLSSRTAQVGDVFQVVVAEDLVYQGVVVVPKDMAGHGQVTFAARKGGFGKAGIIGIALRFLDMDGRKIALDGRYREVGQSNDGGAAVTMAAVGVLGGFVTGKSSAIPKGRVLKARLGEDLVLPAPPSPATPAPPPPPPPPPRS